jgi:hypothetical protein
MLPLAHSVRDVGEHPRLDALVPGGPEVHDRHARPGAVQVERRLGRRVAAADDHGVLLERLVRLVVHVRHVRQRLARHADPVRRPEVARRDDHGAAAQRALLAGAPAAAHDELRRLPLDRDDRLELPHRDAEVPHRAAVVR